MASCEAFQVHIDRGPIGVDLHRAASFIAKHSAVQRASANNGAIEVTLKEGISDSVRLRDAIKRMLPGSLPDFAYIT